MSLPREKIKNIDSLALELLESVYGGRENITTPVDLQKLLDREEITLFVTEFETPGISGILRRSAREIHVSESDTPKRQVFTIAHELGHFFLHPSVPGDIYRTNEITELKSEERRLENEANQFALSVLLPAPLFLEVWKVFKDVSTVSRIFGVSESTVEMRLKSL